ncbi:MAG: hypothetical protein GWN73_00210, partial [Actinobacteria bacterium]|nr:hypothetical protein [Actinomycetota bacterium]NIS28470.1 hypothetical protein [Actinomycetota bacterium]NIU63945.1 hypothetical protein [Actinomycetota bacterium]NIW25742.1 hypothetical protein [Actinomycetota bacterium]
VDESRLRPDGPESVEGVARFLTEDVLPAVDDRVLRRGLKTAAALLETAALRHALEAAVFTERSHATQRLLDDLGEAGVDTAGG